MENYLKRAIERNSAAKGERLELRKKRLTQIPDEVFDLTHLRELHIGHDCPVDKHSIILNEEFWWEVSHDNNTIRTVGPELAKLKNLEEFSSAQIELESFPQGLCELENLIYLNLRNNNITYIPPKIGQLKKLEILDLSYNAISELPPEIGQLTSLRQLLLNSNNLQSIPPELGLLANLEVLDLGNYNHYRIDSDTVKRFNLKLNTISQIPATICQLTKLRILDLQSNALKSLPEEIGSLKNLEWLEIGNFDPADSSTGDHIYPFNTINEIPNGAYDLEKLNRLCLADIDPLCWYR